MRLDETIVAIASPPDPAARGVVRLSGRSAIDVLAQVTQQSGEECSGPSAAGTDTGRQSAYRYETVIQLGRPLGSLLVTVLVWPTRRSYTGQPSVEIHTVGSLPVLEKLVQRCLDCGASPARPGEFTMRAFLAGRMDLTQAEAVLGVIEAENPGSLVAALQQLAGNLSKPLSVVRRELIDLLADVEAGLDFVDEDIEFISDAVLLQRLDVMRDQIDHAVRQVQSRGGVAPRTKVALRGQPNAGKSRLINALAGADASIVADVAGTTRDVVTVDARIERHPISLQDTAGIEVADDSISHDAQSLGDQASHAAAVRLWCVDASRADLDHAVRWVKQEQQRLTDLGPTLRVSADLFVATKTDLVTHRAMLAAIAARNSEDWVCCSAVTGDGIDGLKARIADLISRVDVQETGGVIGTAARCRQSLRLASESIQAAIDRTQQQAGHEFVSAELRAATQAIGEVTGEIYNDDILDRVFGRFCIGK